MALDGIATSTASTPETSPPSLPISVTSWPAFRQRCARPDPTFPLPIVAIFIRPPFLGLPWLKELDWIARRVVDQNLRAARAFHDVVSEAETGRPQTLHLGREIVDEQMDAVPAAGLRLSSVRHRAGGRARRPAEEQPAGFRAARLRTQAPDSSEARNRSASCRRRWPPRRRRPCSGRGRCRRARIRRYRAVPASRLISAAPPTMRLSRGTTSRTLTWAQNAMSASRPGGPYVRARSPSCASGQACAIASAALPESEGSASSSWTIRPAQYASSSANWPWKPAQTIVTSSSSSRAAAATASRLSRLPSMTWSERAAVSRIARVPFVVEKMTVLPRGSPRNSRGDAPTSKPSIRTAFRSPPRIASPSVSLSASASSISPLQ